MLTIRSKRWSTKWCQPLMVPLTKSINRKWGSLLFVSKTERNAALLVHKKTDVVFSQILSGCLFCGTRFSNKHFHFSRIFVTTRLLMVTFSPKIIRNKLAAHRSEQHLNDMSKDFLPLLCYIRQRVTIGAPRYYNDSFKRSERHIKEDNYS